MFNNRIDVKQFIANYQQAQKGIGSTLAINSAIQKTLNTPSTSVSPPSIPENNQNNPVTAQASQTLSEDVVDILQTFNIIYDDIQPDNAGQKSIDDWTLRELHEFLIANAPQYKRPFEETFTIKFASLPHYLESKRDINYYELIVSDVSDAEKKYPHYDMTQAQYNLSKKKDLNSCTLRQIHEFILANKHKLSTALFEVFNLSDTLMFYRYLQNKWGITYNELSVLKIAEAEIKFPHYNMTQKEYAASQSTEKHEDKAKRKKNVTAARNKKSQKRAKQTEQEQKDREEFETLPSETLFGFFEQTNNNLTPTNENAPQDVISPSANSFTETNEFLGLEENFTPNLDDFNSYYDSLIDFHLENQDLNTESWLDSKRI